MMWASSRLVVSSRTTTKSHGWTFPGLDALVAAQMSLSISSSGTGSGFNQRIDTAVLIASRASIAAESTVPAGPYRRPEF
jgi:hypothetical protein